MNAISLTTLIASPKNTLFNYLIDIDNLPEWAVEFCQKLTSNNGKYVVTTPIGELFYSVESDRVSGVIDLITSSDGVSQNILPTRVLGVTDQASVYVVTLMQAPEISDEMFQQQKNSLAREMETLQGLFA